jgi:peroxiredoxin
MYGLRVEDPAPDVTVADHTGQPVRLAELWSRQPLVLLFIRHFG